MLAVAVFVFHPDRVEKHPPPATTPPGAQPSADLSGAMTVGNSAYVAGHYAHLIVNGSHNKVVAENADVIDTDGSGNEVIYRGGAPQSAVGGSGNIVRRG
jgi:hypothetical protein